MDDGARVFYVAWGDANGNWRFRPEQKKSSVGAGFF
jgi:hypothetical protein